MRATVNIHEAKACLSALIAQAEAGDGVIIARANKPVVRLLPFGPLPPPPAKASPCPIHADT